MKFILARYKGDKILIMTDSKENLNDLAILLGEAIPSLEGKIGFISGDVNQTRRREVVNELNKKDEDEIVMLILTPKSGGVALNMQGANHVIFLAGYWHSSWIQ